MKNKYLSLLLLLFLAAVVKAQSFKPVVQNGHAIMYPQNPLIYSLSFSDDGKKIITTGQDASVILWETESGRQITSFNNGYQHSVNGADINLDNKSIALFSAFVPVQVFDISTGELKDSHYESENVWKQIDYHGGAFMYDGKLVACPWGFQVFEPSKQIPVSKNEWSGRDNYIMFTTHSSDRKLLGVVTRDSKTKFFSYPDFKSLGSFSIKDFPRGIRFSNDAQWAGDITEKGVHIYQKTASKYIQVGSQEILEAKDIAFSNDGKEYLVATAYGLNVYSTADHSKRATVENNISKVAISPNGQIIALGTNDPKSQVKLYSYPDLLPLKDFQVNNMRNYTAIASPSGQYLAVGMKNKMVLWNLRKGTVMPSNFKPDFYLDFAFSKDEKTIYAKSEAKIYEYGINGNLIQEKELFGNAISLNADGKLLKVLNPFLNWHLVQTSNFSITETNVHQLGNLGGLEYYNESIISTNGKYAACGAKVFDLTTGQDLFSSEYNYETMSGANASAIDPTGKYFVMGKHIYDLEKKSLIAQLPFRSNTLVSSIEFSLDGQKLYLGMTNGELFVFEANTWRELHREKVSNSAIKKIHVDLKTNRLYLCTMDGQAVSFDLTKNVKKATLIASSLDEFVVTLPSGHYRTSKTKLSSIHFARDGQTFGLESFDLAYNRPDLVISALGVADEPLVNSYQSAWVKRVNKMGFAPEEIGMDIHLPEAQLPNDLPTITKDNTLAFTLKATDSKYTLDRLNIYINSVPIYGKQGLSIRDKEVKSLDQMITLDLSPGLNRIKVSVMNDQGVESIADEHSITCQATFANPSTYVVAIGISDYLDNIYDLGYAAKDANDIAAKFGTDATKVFKLTDRNATKEKILAIKKELMKSKINDRVVLFVAGHGLLDDKLDYYLGTYDVNFKSPAGRGLAYDDLEGLLDGIPAREKLMFIDACHSGEVDKDDSQLVASSSMPVGTIKSRGFKTVASRSEGLGLQNSFELMQELFADLRKGTGAVVISSASGAEFALESDVWKNGVFTFSILEGLQNRKCDTNKDGAVQVSELKNYVFDRVAELTNGKQHPTSRRDNLENDFVVW